MEMRAPVTFYWRPLALPVKKQKATHEKKKRGDENQGRGTEIRAGCAVVPTAFPVSRADVWTHPLSLPHLVNVSRSSIGGTFSAVRRALVLFGPCAFFCFLPLFRSIFSSIFWDVSFFFIKKRARAARHGAP
ncbi:hypothetical protein [Pandoravirus japonicus]|uniref:Transmembrane protein n=1 Tax=Pandoravirus japonicus TaxID=2823154 RepID=A0A811BMW4_9VIRU|nr:hypothetical protein [Pandoravirus japonicus]